MNRALVVSAEDGGLLAGILQSNGFDVLTAADCQSACRQLDTCPPPNVLIADFSLPDGNWCTLLRVLLDRHLDTKLLVCSRFAGSVRIVEVVQRGGEYALVRSHAPEMLPDLADAA